MEAVLHGSYSVDLVCFGKGMKYPDRREYHNFVNVVSTIVDLERPVD
jgi:hypothetical protein